MSYRVRVDVPVALILFVSGLLAARRRSVGTRKGTRRLGYYRQALFALAWYLDRVGIPRLGAGFGLFYPDGRPMWVSDVLPGRVNDLAAAKEQIFAVLRPFTAAMPCLAAGGYEPAGHGV